MGTTPSSIKPVDVPSDEENLNGHRFRTTTDEETIQQKKKAYAHLKSAAPHTDDSNVIAHVYNEDYETVDHFQAIRFPVSIAKQIQTAVHNECVRRCYEPEKTMSRCLQDKMWTTWKCQKERDAYYNCIRDEEQMNTSPTRREEKRLEAASTDNNNTNANKKDDDFVDLITAYRWKYTLGVLNGEIIARNNIMKALWEEHYPDRELPHSWVNGGE